MKTLFIGNLAPTTNERELDNLLSQFGTVRSLKLAKDIFSGICKGFALLEMEGHDAEAVFKNLNGKDFNGKSMMIKYEIKNGRRKRR